MGGQCLGMAGGTELAVLWVRLIGQAPSAQYNSAQ